MSDHTSLDGEIAIVTGGARGIGRAVAELFIDHGAAVVFCDLDADLGMSVENELGDRTTKFVAADVSVEADVSGVVEACTATFGPPTILVKQCRCQRQLRRDDHDRRRLGPVHGRRSEGGLVGGQVHLMRATPPARPSTSTAG